MASLAFAAPARFGRDSEAGVDGAAPLGGSFAPVAGAGAVAEAGGDSGAACAVAEAGGDTGAVAEVGAEDCIARGADTGGATAERLTRGKLGEGAPIHRQRFLVVVVDIIINRDSTCVREYTLPQSRYNCISV